MMFRKYLRRIGAARMLLGISLLADATQAPIAAMSTTQQLAAAIDTTIEAPRFASASWGVAVMSLDTGRMLYAHDADRLLQPASTAKLYTAALVLDTIGADYKIPTQLLASRPIVHGRVQGSLLLRGMGDPTLGTPGTNVDWADQLATQLSAEGIHDIQGDLIADDSYFRGPLMGAGWEAGDLQSSFAAPTSALSVQENTVTATVAPAKVPGYPALLTLDPGGAIPHVVHTLATSISNTPNDINLYRAPGDATLYAFGRIAAGSEPQEFKLSMVDPAWYAGTLLRDALTRHGIHLRGALRVHHWPDSEVPGLDNPVVLAQVTSPPVIDILERGLKRSQNLYLQNLLQIVGVKIQVDAEGTGNPTTGFLSSEGWAIHGLRQLLTRIGIAPGSAQIEDGAGLSRQDLSTANAMVRLLAFIAQQPYGDRLKDALPDAGVDGTLEWRMRDTPAADNVHAKTGSMTNVRCLAGYVTTAAGEHLAFVIMLNNFVRTGDDPTPSRELDQIAEWLSAFKGHS